MRKHIIIATAVAAFATAGIATVTIAAEPAPKTAVAGVTLDQAIDGIEARYRDVTSFEAEFTQLVKLAHLPRPRKKTGKVYYMAPGKMRWDYLAPERVYYVSDGNFLWSYEVAAKQVTKLPVKDSELYDSLKFLFGKGDLRGSFDATLAGPDKDGNVGVRLVPKKGTQNYKSLTLWAKPDTFEIVGTELVNPVDGTSTITFSKVSYEPLKPEGFDFTPPKGVAIQDMTGGAGKTNE